MEIHNEQCLGRSNARTTHVFFAFHTSVAASKFTAKCVGHLGDVSIIIL